MAGLGSFYQWKCSSPEPLDFLLQICQGWSGTTKDADIWLLGQFPANESERNLWASDWQVNGDIHSCALLIIEEQQLDLKQFRMFQSPPITGCSCCFPIDSQTTKYCPYALSEAAEDPLEVYLSYYNLLSKSNKPIHLKSLSISTADNIWAICQVTKVIPMFTRTQRIQDCINERETHLGKSIISH